MKKYFTITLLLILSLAIQAQQLIDRDATKETKALYKNLKMLSQKGFLFGHHEDDAYGVGWSALPGRSDVKDIVGSYPAVHGWDLGKIEYNAANNIDGVDFAKQLQWIEAVYKRGGVNTISWHVDNPLTKKDAWDKTPAVKSILPGGINHDYFVKQLDNVAEFLNKCQSSSTKIPMIFRPWHEHNGDWFWWGKGNCSEEDFVQLWKFTVTYLRDVKKLHHLIYAFSPDRSRMDLTNAENSYYYAYPGDDYVDVIGLDDYQDVGEAKTDEEFETKKKDFVTVLSSISAIAEKKNKVAALTETGQEGVKNPTWYTDVLLNPIKSNTNIHIAYVMVWRNANTKHHYAPYSNHSSAEDFKTFYTDPYTLFESDLKGIYK